MNTLTQMHVVNGHYNRLQGVLQLLQNMPKFLLWKELTLQLMN